MPLNFLNKEYSGSNGASGQLFEAQMHALGRKDAPMGARLLDMTAGYWALLSSKSSCRTGGDVSDALIGVVIGGLIAWVAPLLTLRYSERRWRFEARVGYLKAERNRFEKLYERNLQRFAKGLEENAYSSEMSAEIFALMPKEIAGLYEEWMAEKEKDDFKRKVAYLEMASAMKRDLAKKDSDIRNLFED
jgi:gas vesicle protein